MSKKKHDHTWKLQQGGAMVTNSTPDMWFKVCRCGACEHITYNEARKMGAPV